jgi:tRNA threonylcarbamoyladenosine biosynthesis protein TsaB
MNQPVLAISTSASRWSLWLGCDPWQDGEEVALTAPRGAPRDLVGAIDALMQRRGVAPADLRGIVVDTGPGSFTSLRMGLATVRALAWGAGLAVAPCGSLETLLAEARAGDRSRAVVAALPARRGWWYAASQGYPDGHPLAAWQSPRLVSDDDWMAQVAAGTAAIGGPADGHGAIATTVAPSARWMARLALGADTPWLAAQEVLPAYVAASEAEVAAGLRLQEVAAGVEPQPL